MARNLIAELRKNKGITQTMLAAKAGVSVRTVYSIEKGKKSTPWIRRRIMKALELDYNADYSWVFPNDETCLVIVEMYHDKVNKLFREGTDEEIIRFGRTILASLSDDGTTQKALIYNKA